MKRIYLLLIFVIIGFTSSFSQSAETVPNTLMIGNIEVEDFQKEPFIKWYKEEYNNYQVDTNALKNLSKKAKKVEVKIFFGSWCSDSRREVPRFVKIMDAANIKTNKLHFQGLDRAKMSPEYRDNKYGIEYVPTFIFIKKGKEIGRIIETPIETLEKDIIKILNQN